MDYKPTRPANKQAGGKMESIVRASAPFQQRQNAFQAETRSPLAYQMEDNKMPPVDLVVGGGGQVKNFEPVKQTYTGQPFGFRNESDLTAKESIGPENARAKFIDLGMDTPPGSFGHYNTY